MIRRLIILLLIVGCEEPTEFKEIVIDGYLDKMSYYSGEQAKLYINAQYYLESDQLGIYDINGILEFELIATIFQQSIDNDKPWELGYGYDVTTEFEVPDLISGIYLVENKIPFIIKTTNPVDAIVVYPTNTLNAYNQNEGYSFYTDPPTPILSFHRPQKLPQNNQGVSIGFYQWLLNTDYTYGYLTDYDLEDENCLEESNIIILSGHSEYWSRNARVNFDEFIDNGNNALVLSGNTMWWQVRYAQDGSQLIGYKYQDDPTDDPQLKTIGWYESELNYPIISSIGADFRYGGYGLRDDLGWDGYKIVLPESPLFKNCTITTNQIITNPTLEYDGSPIIGITDDGIPIIDKELLNFYQIELLGYDIGFRGEQTYGTFIVFQKQESSGMIINMASTDWCNRGFIDTDSQLIKQITLNAIDLLLTDESVFSNP